MNEKVKLEHKGGVKELTFEHALNILRSQQSSGIIIFKVVGNHEFKNNELIIKRNNKASADTTKHAKRKGGGKATKQNENLNDSL